MNKTNKFKSIIKVICIIIAIALIPSLYTDSEIIQNSILFFWFIALIFSFVGGNKESDKDLAHQNKNNKDGLKKCPMCAETIKFEAIICRYCGYKFDPNQILNKTNEIKTDNAEEVFVKKAEQLKTNLEDDEMIILMKKKKELKVIKKSQYESDMGLHLTKNYVVVDKN